MSCTDPLFSTKQNTISNHGVDVSIFDKCRHNIIFGKINNCVPLPTVYICKVWNYSQANVKNKISTFNWSKVFEKFSVDGKEKLNTWTKHY